MPEDRYSRRDAAKKLVDEFDKNLQFWGNSHRDKVANPEWEMPIVMPLGKWRRIVEALRPLAESE